MKNHFSERIFNKIWLIIVDHQVTYHTYLYTKCTMMEWNVKKCFSSMIEEAKQNWNSALILLVYMYAN